MNFFPRNWLSEILAFAGVVTTLQGKKNRSVIAHVCSAHGVHSMTYKKTPVVDVHGFQVVALIQCSIILWNFISRQGRLETDHKDVEKEEDDH